MSKYTTLMKVYLFRDVSEVMLAGREASPRVHKDQLSPATLISSFYHLVAISLGFYLNATTPTGQNLRRLYPKRQCP